jgi:hypothetical protein
MTVAASQKIASVCRPLQTFFTHTQLIPPFKRASDLFVVDLGGPEANKLEAGFT